MIADKSKNHVIVKLVLLYSFKIFNILDFNKYLKNNLKLFILFYIKMLSSPSNCSNLNPTTAMHKALSYYINQSYSVYGIYVMSYEF